MPWFVSEWFVLLVFLAFLLAFHAVLVWLFPQSQSFWRKVDYVWLSFALLGVLGAVGANSELVANAKLDREKFYLQISLRNLAEISEVASSDVVCRKLGDGEPYATPSEMAERQKGYDYQCQWFSGLKGYFERSEKEILEKVEPEGESGPLPTGGVSEYNRMFREQIDSHNAAVSDALKLRDRAGPTFFSETLLFFGPFLIAVALALRITKVTAEILQQKAGQKPPEEDQELKELG